LLQLGAIPLTFSDSSGFVYEQGGFDDAKLKTVEKIKSERGTRIGRYIIASTSAKFNEPASIFDVPCDLIFPCSNNMPIDELAITKLASNGCQGIIEGVHRALQPTGLAAAKKVPYTDRNANVFK
jgi:glutamate dehydrogenase (NADP+)